MQWAQNEFCEQICLWFGRRQVCSGLIRALVWDSWFGGMRMQSKLLISMAYIRRNLGFKWERIGRLWSYARRVLPTKQSILISSGCFAASQWRRGWIASSGVPPRNERSTRWRYLSKRPTGALFPTTPTPVPVWTSLQKYGMENNQRHWLNTARWFLDTAAISTPRHKTSDLHDST